MEDLIKLVVDNGIGVFCVVYIIIFQSTTLKDIQNTLIEISKNLTLMNERLEKLERDE